ncbi:protein of unknown function [Desulfovibrio sp. 86]|jgi:hypothetical protein|nr:protein of unknown function [Desulfovibrio sp. 86]
MGARPVTPEQDTCAQTSVHQSILNFFDEKGKPKGWHYRMAGLPAPEPTRAEEPCAQIERGPPASASSPRPL